MLKRRRPKKARLMKVSRRKEVRKLNAIYAESFHATAMTMFVGLVV
jgi:hypothetical protein